MCWFADWVTLLLSARCKYKVEVLAGKSKGKENSRDLSLAGNRNTMVLKEQDMKMWNALNRLSVLSIVGMTWNVGLCQAVQYIT